MEEEEEANGFPPDSLPPEVIIPIVIFALIFIVGIVGNTLVIYVVVRFSKMQTVTNMYIVNLAIADECFLLSVPVLITTMIYNQFVFPAAVCKIYYICTSVNQFTSSILVLIISIDRYIAVCHSVSSPRWRTPLISKILSALAWSCSILLMIPIIQHAEFVTTQDHINHCVIQWGGAGNPNFTKLSNYSAVISSNGSDIANSSTITNNTSPTNSSSAPSSSSGGNTELMIYTIYLCITAFIVPFTFILIFYCLIIKKLLKVGSIKKSKGKDRSNRKVTKLVMTVIAVYIICGVPYWVNQIYIVLSKSEGPNRAFFLFSYCLNYANPAFNPIIYAFLSDNFRKSFTKAFACIAAKEVNASLQEDKSIFPAKKISDTKLTRVHQSSYAEESDADSTLCRRDSAQISVPANAGSVTDVAATELLNKEKMLQNGDNVTSESTSL